jgi:hypothetical protein
MYGSSKSLPTCLQRIYNLHFFVVVLTLSLSRFQSNFVNGVTKFYSWTNSENRTPDPNFDEERAKKQKQKRKSVVYFQGVWFDWYTNLYVCTYIRGIRDTCWSRTNFQIIHIRFLFYLSYLKYSQKHIYVLIRLSLSTMITNHGSLSFQRII